MDFLQEDSMTVQFMTTSSSFDKGSRQVYNKIYETHFHVQDDRAHVSVEIYNGSKSDKEALSSSISRPSIQSNKKEEVL